MIAALISISGTLSLATLAVALAAVASAAFASWKFQSSSALERSAELLRKDRDDWKARAESEATGRQQDNDRMQQKIAEMDRALTDSRVAIARLEAMTDTTQLARADAVEHMRHELDGHITRAAERDNRVLDLVGQILARNPDTRTRSTD